ncbi:hypothetical protein F511_25618 [Dorcoceras hygrometricum]|uniref:Uncharacterized protein n=1 Tax=Dorcoceras hygrometricum TaxID=472368 RepID=A0A2Z7CW38_9LAMI|nr:hypothetical protein F511_25618 [Dorcoceras hygrometricum]
MTNQPDQVQHRSVLTQLSSDLKAGTSLEKHHGTLPLTACAHQQISPATAHNSVCALNSSSAQLSSRVRRFSPKISEELGQILPDLTNKTGHNKYRSNSSQQRTSSRTGQLT